LPETLLGVTAQERANRMLFMRQVDVQQ